MRRTPDDQVENSSFEPIVPEAAPRAALTSEDLLREEAIETTRIPALWEPGTALYEQQPIWPEEKPTDGVNGDMDMDIIGDTVVGGDRASIAVVKAR